MWTAVHSHALKAKAVHRVVPGGWEGGLLTALLPHGGAGGFIPKPHSEVLKSVQMPHPGTTPQIYTIGRMVVTYATRGNYGISVVMKIFWFISVTENSGAICFSLSCARFSKIFRLPSRSRARVSIKFIHFPPATPARFTVLPHYNVYL